MKENRNSNDELNKNLKNKGIIIPIIFAIAAAVIVIIASSPALGFFPNGNHDDSLTTTAPTQTTEYVTDEYAQGK